MNHVTGVVVLTSKIFNVFTSRGSQYNVTETPKAGQFRLGITTLFYGKILDI